jgi:predicted CXXCH cytochrome family protein
VGEEQCTACHFPEEGFLRDEHSLASFSPPADDPAVCLPCHGAAAKELTGPVLHEPAGTDNCGMCHRPHASDHPFLLAASYPEGTFALYGSGTYSLCWNCHDSALAEEKSTVSSTGFRRGKRNFHYSHLQKRNGMACRACHTLHGGRQAHLVREESPPGGPAWKNGMRFENSPSGGRCIGGCHKDISYSR